jgi:hypothetical protein
MPGHPHAIEAAAVGCLFALLAGIFPRIGLVVLWIFTNEVDRAYDTFVVPLLGLIFFPLTTIVYALAWAPVGGAEGLDWFWIGLAFVFDVASIGGGAAARRGD